jgi:hypothetical protein
MEMEGVPVPQYEQLAKIFKPQPNAARAWAKLAKQAGQKYMVMTTSHHEGFCNWDTKLTNYCAPKQGPGRDLVAEYVEAARAEGLHVGFYYSLMDWHQADAGRFTGLPHDAPDQPVTVIEVKCEPSRSSMAPMCEITGRAPEWGLRRTYCTRVNTDWARTTFAGNPRGQDRVDWRARSDGEVAEISDVRE